MKQLFISLISCFPALLNSTLIFSQSSLDPGVDGNSADSFSWNWEERCYQIYPTLSHLDSKMTVSNIRGIFYIVINCVFYGADNNFFKFIDHSSYNQLYPPFIGKWIDEWKHTEVGLGDPIRGTSNKSGSIWFTVTATAVSGQMNDERVYEDKWKTNGSHVYPMWMTLNDPSGWNQITVP